ncbi:hypothetical protein [Streptomyces sp. NPDC003006]
MDQCGPQLCSPDGKSDALGEAGLQEERDTACDVFPGELHVGVSLCENAMECGRVRLIFQGIKGFSQQGDAEVQQTNEVQSLVGREAASGEFCCRESIGAYLSQETE